MFSAPWQAEAFALALSLNERGLFTWKEWASTLGDEIKKAQAAGDPDTGETYYHHWLATLERIVAAKGLADAGLLARTASLEPRVRAHAAWHADRAAPGRFQELNVSPLGGMHVRSARQNSLKRRRRVRLLSRHAEDGCAGAGDGTGVGDPRRRCRYPRHRRRICRRRLHRRGSRSVLADGARAVVAQGRAHQKTRPAAARADQDRRSAISPIPWPTCA